MSGRGGALSGRAAPLFYRTEDLSQAVQYNVMRENAPARTPRFGVLRLSAPALIVACALFLPFLNKAYLIDDPYFLLQAQQITHEFLRPMNFTICWFDNCACSPAYRLAPGAALMGYVLFPVIQFAALESVVHLVQLLTLLAALVATVSLALRWGAGRFEAGAAAMLLATFPPVLALTDTAMPDVLAMSLAVIGIERFSAWLEDGRIPSATVAALALGLAPFARLHAIGMIGLAFVMAATTPRTRPARRWLDVLPLLAAAALFLALSLVTREPGSAGPLPPASRISAVTAGDNTRSLLSYYILCFPVAVMWLLSQRRRAVWLIAYAAAAYLIFLALARQGILASGISCMAAVSALSIAHLLWRGARRRSRELLLGAWLLAPCVAIPYLHLPPKYLMLSAPAAAIAGVALLRGESPAFRRTALAAFIAVGAVASVLILTADARFADMSRQASADLVAPHVAKGERVWFTGEWGLYWYAQKAGARVVMAGASEPKPGDLLIAGKQDGGAPVLERFPRRTLMEERVFAWTGGRTMSLPYRAGLYSNSWGPLPWSWGSGEVDRFQLWRID